MFLLSKCDTVDINRVIVPDKKTVLNTLKYKIGNWDLLLIGEKANDSIYHVTIQGKGNGVLIGTPMFKNFSFEHILEKVVVDFWSNDLDIDQLKGNFTFIFWKDEQIYFLNDKIGVQPIFYDEKNHRFSSSFLLLLQNSPEKFKINRNALLEKLSTGFIIGSDTLVSGIHRILPYNKSNVFTFKDVHLINHNYENINTIALHDNGKSNSINTQINQLRSYFKLINKTFQNETGDLGLSSGFDCRLILGLADKYLDNKLHLHSHNTRGVHDNEIRYANELAIKYNSNIDLIPTQRLEGYDDEKLENILNENLNFFDGRSARHLGAFSETYTYGYKKATMGNAAYSLNGLGGEIYRDSYFTGKKLMSWKDWVNRYIFMPFSEEAAGSLDLLNETGDYLRHKLEMQLKLNYDKMDIFSTHAYYGLIKMPQCNGAVATAYSKVSPFLFPFIEYENIIEALKATPYLGIGGQYQAELIRRISPNLAKTGSHYGFSFDKLSAKYLIWSKLKTMGSVNKRTRLVRTQLLKKLNAPPHLDILNFVNEKKHLKEAKDVLLSFSPQTDFDKLLIESTQRRYIIYLAFMLRKLSGYIEN